MNKGSWWLEVGAGLCCLPSEGKSFDSSKPALRLLRNQENMCYLFSGEDFCAKYQVSSCEVISDWGWGIKYSVQIQEGMYLISGVSLEGRTGQRVTPSQGPSQRLEISSTCVPHWGLPVLLEGLGLSHWAARPGCLSLLSTVQQFGGRKLISPAHAARAHPLPTPGSSRALDP